MMKQTLLHMLAWATRKLQGEPSSGASQQPEPPAEMIGEAPHLAPYDEHLLERARMQWHLGDWDGLAALNRTILQSHPDRAKLALLVASALQQIEQPENAARYVQLARDWGCSKKLIAQILVAGVHNSLGRAAALLDDQLRAQAHFKLAVASGTPGMDSLLVAQTRARHEMTRLMSVMDTDMNTLNDDTAGKNTASLVS